MSDEHLYFYNSITTKKQKKNSLCLSIAEGTFQK